MNVDQAYAVYNAVMNQNKSEGPYHYGRGLALNLVVFSYAVLGFYNIKACIMGLNLLKQLHECGVFGYAEGASMRYVTLEGRGSEKV